MKFTSSVLLALTAAITAVSAGCSNVGGNYYCSETNKIIYSGLGYSGTYQDVTNMDETSGQCSQQPYSFSGNLSPLDEELSVHFRGPLKLLQFGVYYPSSSNQKREDDEECVTKHVHHKHKRATEIIEVTETVLVDAQGNPISTTAIIATVSVESAPAPAGTASPVGPANGAGQGNTNSPDVSTNSPPTTTSSNSVSGSTASVAAGDWERSSYYTPGSADNCVFLNYFGGSGSGVWSSTFGNSLSYANSDASGGSSSPVALGDVTIPSNTEFVIMAGNKCSGNDCGYYRNGIPAYHGFGGNSKIFVFEFEMPSDSGSGFNADMPAIWLLNAKIPRTLQYGDATCSCWKTGCGEMDLFEILSSGSDKLISHLHDGQGSDGTSNGGGGSQDYFTRPTSGSLKAAVIFTDTQIHILEVDVDFDSSLSQETVEGWIQQQGSAASLGY